MAEGTLSWDRVQVEREVETVSRPSLSYWQDAWIRLKANRRALISLYWPSRCSGRSSGPSTRRPRISTRSARRQARIAAPRWRTTTRPGVASRPRPSAATAANRAHPRRSTSWTGRRRTRSGCTGIPFPAQAVTGCTATFSIRSRTAPWDCRSPKSSIRPTSASRTVSTSRH
ncbi:MAG: hypothetical protein J4F45_14800 [Pseudomonadales bacterium]|nr:hypothetical protein [Pseudomonadales bacterium]